MFVCVCVCFNRPYRAYRQGVMPRAGLIQRSCCMCVCVCVCVCVSRTLIKCKLPRALSFLGIGEQYGGEVRIRVSLCGHYMRLGQANDLHTGHTHTHTHTHMVIPIGPLYEALASQRPTYRTHTHTHTHGDSCWGTTGGVAKPTTCVHTCTHTHTRTHRHSTCTVRKSGSGEACVGTAWGGQADDLCTTHTHTHTHMHNTVGKS